MPLKQITKEKLLFNNNRTNPQPLESDRRKREELTPMENMLRAALDNTAALLPSSADLDFPSRWEGKRKRDIQWDERYRSLFYHTVCPEIVWLNWAEIGRTESEPHGKQCHIVSRTCTLMVCMCNPVCVCLWLVSRAIGFSTEWKRWGGVCSGRSLLLCSCEGPLYKTRRMSELQSYQAFQTFDRWCRSTGDSRRFSLGKVASRDHSSLQRRWAYICVCITQFDPFPFWKCSRLSAGLRQSEKYRGSRSEEGDFESICFLKQASFVSSRWGRQNGHVSTPPALYVL